MTQDPEEQMLGKVVGLGTNVTSSVEHILQRQRMKVCRKPLNRYTSIRWPDSLYVNDNVLITSQLMPPMEIHLTLAQGSFVEPFWSRKSVKPLLSKVWNLLRRELYSTTWIAH